MKINPAGINIEYHFPKDFNPFVYLLFAPIDWKAELNPCNKCKAKKTNAKQ